MQTIIHNVRTFAHEHDELPAFHAGYLVLTFLAAAMFNLGAFGLLILAHMALDVVKYREYHKCSWRLTFEGLIRESLVDVTLFAIGLVFAVYLHHSVGVASVSGMLRAEFTVLRAMGTLLPKIKILHHFLKVMSHMHHYIEELHPRLRKGWSKLDHLCFHFLGVSILLLVAAAPLMGVEWELVRAILMEELVPWKL